MTAVPVPCHPDLNGGIRIVDTRQQVAYIVDDYHVRLIGLDDLEHDFRAIYSDCTPPFPEGYEESLRQMLIDSKKHFL